MTLPYWAQVRIEKALELNHPFLDLRRRIGDPELTEIPPVIYALRNLKKLDLSNNAIKVIPNDIVNLEKLEELLLNKNQIIELPEIFTRLENIQILALSGNQIKEFPKVMTELPNLTRVNLAYNEINEIPTFVHDLKKISWLDLSDNLIVQLPATIVRLEHLSELRLRNNPLVTPPIEIADKGLYAMREYYRQLEQGKDYLFEAKLLIIGEGGAGKTTLAHKIEDPNYLLHEEQTTEGIDVLRWSFPLENGKKFQVNIWDFGGQEIYHTTHQFFLTKRSLYILVADTRNEDTNFYYWLSAVDLLSDNSPLIIVKNEKQDRHRDINERQLRGQFENLKEVCSTNLATNKDLDKIITEIQHYLKKLPHVGSALPNTWLRVREFLEADKRDYISLEEYLSVCKQNGFHENKDSLQLSSYLHDIGVILHFQNDPLLKRIVILKPKWGTNAVYKVLDNKMVIRNSGRFARSDLLTIWIDPEYENMFDELLQLMMKFRLCYEIPNAPGNYIAPQLLTENQPEYRWEDQNNLLLRYTYEFLPKGVLTQFIVSMHPYIWEQQYVWKSGVVLEKNSTKAEVVEHYGKREIRLRLVGPHKKELMAIAIHELDKIHNNYRRLRYDKLIPCNCKDCRDSLDPYFYKYEQLQRFIEKELADIQCGNTGKMVNVRELIDDVFKIKSHSNNFEPPTVQYNVYGNYISGGENVLLDLTNNTTTEENIYALNGIKDSFNIIEDAQIHEELKQNLEQLTQAVERMIEDLPQDKASEIAENMKSIANEATKENPDKRWYSVSIEGLIKAAENIDKVGEPVIELSRKVLSLLTLGAAK